MKKRRKPVKKRETIEVDGEQRRLAWVAENRPGILVRRIASGHMRSSAYWSALAKAGLDRPTVEARCEEWNVDPGVLGQQ